MSLRVLMDLSYTNSDAYERSCPRLPSAILYERLILSVDMSSAEFQACVDSLELSKELQIKMKENSYYAKF